MANGFRLYIPNGARLTNLHKTLYDMAQNYHLRAILKNNEDLFIADGVNILAIMMAEYDYKYETLTTRQEEKIIHEALHEFIPVMEASVMADLHEQACARSGRGSDHLYTLDLIDSMQRDYEEWITQRYRCDSKPIFALLLEQMFEENIKHNLAPLIYGVKKHNQEEAFPDLNIHTCGRENLLLSVGW